jgi:hypothetical protein
VTTSDPELAEKRKEMGRGDPIKSNMNSSHSTGTHITITTTHSNIEILNVPISK